MAMGCAHCGFDGDLEHKGNVIAEHHASYAENYGEYVWDRIWSLLRCPRCERPTLQTYVWSDDFSDPGDTETTQLYPASVDNASLPPSVQKQLDIALRVKSLEAGLYAVAIRRLLEAVCQEENAAGATLYEQIDALVEAGRLPHVFERMATQLRKLGNLGAHVLDAEVEASDVPLIEEFANMLLEYLYRAPAKVDALEKALAARLGRG